MPPMPFSPATRMVSSGKSGLRHQFCFHSALGSYDHDAAYSFRLAPEPFSRDSNGGKNVPASAAACDQQILGPRAAGGDVARGDFGFSRDGCSHVSSACWLMFNSTPVANNMANRLDPP